MAIVAKSFSRSLISGIVASTLAVMTVKPADAESRSEAQQRNVALVQSRFDAWSNGTGSPFELLANDARWTIEGNSVASRTYPCKEDFLREVIRPFNARMQAPLKPAIRNIYADGDTVIVFFDARGMARDGRPYVNTYAWFLDMRDNQIVRASAFFDAIEFNDLWMRVPPTD
ncbi:nuclear transport factor 2 family protein [Sphingobium phenoxybenzoativorans]|uniref:Nuclear transport factor 2 family protein n=1 Tax=Sphingobium phenoxybenzoativorans TaxID=1592790 RepID=A0A975Q0P9_9SPHN|nr:nuclear transport factor 2 family protein [Sphingobium phenoxybenzoativorans]QUT05095.1 nuclear transport factor 2 family protein [Sphingobium phenoxybenzoativorans]